MHTKTLNNRIGYLRMYPLEISCTRLCFECKFKQQQGNDTDVRAKWLTSGTCLQYAQPYKYTHTNLKVGDYSSLADLTARL